MNLDSKVDGVDVLWVNDFLKSRRGLDAEQRARADVAGARKGSAPDHAVTRTDAAFLKKHVKQPVRFPLCAG